MRLVNKPEKKDLIDKQTYLGTIQDYKFNDVTTKKGKHLKSIKIRISPDDDSLKSATAFDWVGEDNDGTFIYRNSKLDTWLQRIFNVSDIGSVRLDDIKGKKCLFVVSVNVKKDEKTGKDISFFNVDDILSLPVGAYVAPAAAPQPVAQPAPQPAPAPVQAAAYVATAPQPAAMPVQGAAPVAAPAGQNGPAQPVASGKADWSNGAIL
jgi:hypothetical protein